MSLDTSAMDRRGFLVMGAAGVAALSGCISPPTNIDPALELAKSDDPAKKLKALKWLLDNWHETQSGFKNIDNPLAQLAEVISCFNIDLLKPVLITTIPILNPGSVFNKVDSSADLVKAVIDTTKLHSHYDKSQNGKILLADCVNTFVSIIDPVKLAAALKKIEDSKLSAEKSNGAGAARERRRALMEGLARV